MNNIAYVTELNDGNFDTITKSNKLVLVDVWAEWCGPCKMISPIIDEISAEYQGRVLVGKLNADSNRDTVVSLGVRNIPAVFLYKDGEIVEKSIGASSKQKFVELIDKHL